LAQAAAYGATATVSPAQIIDQLRSGVVREYDVVVEASGAQAGLDLAGTLVREHGVLSILGYHQTSRVVDLASWNYKALDVVNAHVRDHARMADSVRRGLRLAAAGRVDGAALVSHHFPLERLNDAFNAMVDKPQGFIKAVIDL
jgi:threonine dehydrogenase-like Zn-dependent dehydrogenase